MAGSKLFLFALIGLLLPACATGPVEATYKHEFVEFEDLRVTWIGCLLDAESGQQQNPNCENSGPVIIRLDARVRDIESELPINNVRVWFNSTYELVYLLPQEVLEAIEVPVTEGWDQALGRGDIWAEFAGTFEGDYRPTYHEGWTDANGVASVWLFVEEMPRSAVGAATESSVIVSMASDVSVVKLTPGGA